MRNTALVGVMCAGLAAALVGCGGGGEKDPDAGTNGVGKLSATKIESKARRAAQGADTVHLAGVLVSKGRSFKLDMKLREDGGTGQVSTNDSTFQLLRVGDDLYLKADAAFWTQQDGSEADQAAAKKLEDRYVKVPLGDPSYKQLSGFTDKDVLLDGLLGLHGKISAGDRGAVGGVRTIRIQGGDGAGGSLDVSLEGTPYPLRLQRAGGAGVITLKDWNQNFRLVPPNPTSVVDYGQQLPTHT